jgi:hypothetical protein
VSGSIARLSRIKRRVVNEGLLRRLGKETVVVSDTLSLAWGVMPTSWMHVGRQ